MKAILVIHGFTATPECMESIVLPLQKAGFLVKAPLLAGHGTSAWDLSRKKWEDWYESVRKAMLELQQQSDSVSIVGHSLGGLLALKLAEDFSVEKLALLATPLLFKTFAVNHLLPFIEGNFLKYLYRFQPKLFGPAIADRAARKKFKSYYWMPLSSVLEIVKLQKVVQGDLKKIKAPTLILHSRHDTTAPYESVDFLKKNLGSKDIRVVTLEKSDHVLMFDYEKDQVTEEVVKFMTLK